MDADALGFAPVSNWADAKYPCCVRRGLHAAIAALAIGALVGLSAPAWAEPSLPTFDGTTSFPAIQGTSDPENFSWEVELSDGQELQLVDSRHAAVYYTEDGQLALDITAGEAHDAVGSDVPTSLAVFGENVITLTVHHRVGNPVAGGAPFEYPVLAGAGWPGGPTDPEIVKGPMDEQELREARERIERANPAALDAGVRNGCRVPMLKGRSLRNSKRQLRQSGCRIGQVKRLKGTMARAGRVIRQNPKPGNVLPSGATIDVTLNR